MVGYRQDAHVLLMSKLHECGGRFASVREMGVSMKVDTAHMIGVYGLRAKIRAVNAGPEEPA